MTKSIADYHQMALSKVRKIKDIGNHSVKGKKINKKGECSASKLAANCEQLTPIPVERFSFNI